VLHCTAAACFREKRTRFDRRADRERRRARNAVTPPYIYTSLRPLLVRV
jgi:hypothetical protein